MTRTLATAQDRQIAHLEAVGQAANEAASDTVMIDFSSRKARRTLIRHAGDLAVFADYLATRGIETTGARLATDPAAWRGITWGLVDLFVKWQLNAGYAVSTANVRLSTVKTYAGLAAKAGALTQDAYNAIRAVKGYTRKQAIELDDKRQQAGQPTRRTATRRGVATSKKGAPVRITPKHAAALKAHNLTTPQGQRDALLMALLLDHGLRCGEVALLQVTDVDLKSGELRFYRPKVDIVQTHKLSPDALAALKAWFESGHALASGPLLRATRKGGELTTAGMSDRAITKRVRYLGAHLPGELVLHGLSAHDCRHFWATKAARKGISPFRLQEAGGWNSLAMPRRYVDAAAVANEGWEW